MKVPKEIRAYCKKCNSHTAHEVSLYKRGKESVLAAGARRHERDKKGYGGQKFPQQRDKAKTTQKRNLRLRCKKCGRVCVRTGIRLRRLEIAR